MRLLKYGAADYEDVPDEDVIDRFVNGYYDRTIHQAPLRHVLGWFLYDPIRGMNAAGYTEDEFERVYQKVHKTMRGPEVPRQPGKPPEAG